LGEGEWTDLGNIYENTDCSMTRKEQIALIRQKCIEANPQRHPPWKVLRRHDSGEHIIETPCFLPDVLLAMGKSTLGFGWNCRPNDDKLFFHQNGPYYSLLDGDLTRQTDECINFLANMLQQQRTAK
jgi:hypothetical protein